MTLLQFKDELLKRAIELGCTSAEVYCNESDSFSVTVENQQIDKYNAESSRSLSLRVVYDGHDGFASTEVYEDADVLIKNAIDNAKIITSTDDHPMQSACKYEEFSKPNQPLLDMTESECIELAKKLERAVLDSDKRIKRTIGASVSVQKSSVLLANTLGLCASENSGFTSTFAHAVMENGEEEINGYAFNMLSKAADIESLADETVKELTEKLGASPVESGKYKVLFTNKCFCDMLELFVSVFSAYAAQKGLSKFLNKEGEQVASECVNICDDPHNEFYPIAFDLEGTPTKYKDIIKNGRLVTLLHSLKTAKVQGTETTGNGLRSGDCTVTNFYVKPGKRSFEELVSGERVLVISEVDGQGTGVNEVSGEFSLSARGSLYENGNRVKAVNQITVAGSFFDLLKNIEEVGNDLVLYNQVGLGFIGSPCVLVKELVIAG